MSAEEATEAIFPGLVKLARRAREEDPWQLLPFNDFKDMDPRMDFHATWRDLEMGAVGESSLKSAMEYVRQMLPFTLPDEFAAKMGSYETNKNFLVFVATAVCLQAMVGRSGYILLPQRKLANLFGKPQQSISTYCRVAQQAGILKMVEAPQHLQRKATKWQCTLQPAVLRTIKDSEDSQRLRTTQKKY